MALQAKSRGMNSTQPINRRKDIILFITWRQNQMVTERQDVPKEFTRTGNTDHRGVIHPVEDKKIFQYGTAGFRADSSLLPFIVYRMGYLAGLRSRFLNKAIGVMITASHNPENDNGVKLIDPKGEMLEASWEKAANEIVNCTDHEFPTVYRAMESEFAAAESDHARVLSAYDSRPSSEYLQTALFNGVKLSKSQFKSFDLLTTPQLHYIVRCENDPNYGPPDEGGYYQTFAGAFNAMLKLTDCGTHYSPTLHLDCSNGVGASKFRQLASRLTDGILNVVLINEKGPLNEKCGADFVKIAQTFPNGFEKIEVLQRCASFDGDADRLVYFYRNTNGNFVLLDGDKIAVLIAKYLHEQLVGAGLDKKLSLVVVQTGYANGNSTKYIREKMGLEVKMVPTGVKHLHHEACKYDLGVYFEANGHGTVTFSERFRKFVFRYPQSHIRSLKGISDLLLALTLHQQRSFPVCGIFSIATNLSNNYFKGLEVKMVPTGVKHLHHEACKYDVGVYFEANGHGTVTFSERFRKFVFSENSGEGIELKRLRCFSTLINEVVGDAMTDLLAVEILLRHYDWTIDDWANQLYLDSPSCQLKVKVNDRSIFKTTFDEMTCLEPKGLQDAIDALIASNGQGRSFVRPSGTEDIVRVYAEGSSAENARELAEKVADAIRTITDSADGK
uniref:Phosphoacetylglucosamine mutase n=1 Tax=Ascaris lumbricoides TaxID=6252 RepID=A0A0M3I418_ASCLU